eukprot:2677785-Pyramimonas_sp.AAC.2
MVQSSVVCRMAYVRLARCRRVAFMSHVRSRSCRRIAFMSHIRLRRAHNKELWVRRVFAPCMVKELYLRLSRDSRAVAQTHRGTSATLESQARPVSHLCHICVTFVRRVISLAPLQAQTFSEGLVREDSHAYATIVRLHSEARMIDLYGWESTTFVLDLASNYYRNQVRSAGLSRRKKARTSAK